MGKIFADIVSK